MLRQFAVALAVSLPLTAQMSDALVLLRVDVIATDAQGQRVRGLTAADFEILEKGERRGIVELTEFSSTATTAAPSDGSADRYVPLATPASPTPRRRLTIVFADDVTAAQRDAAMTFIQKHTRAGDIVSVASAGNFDSRLASSVLQLARHPGKKAIVLYGEASPAAIAFAKRRGVSIVKPEAIEDLANYYSIAFRGRDPGAIEIKTSRPYSLQTTFAAPALPADDAFSDRVLLNHLIPQRNQLRIDVAASQGAAVGEKRTVKVNLLIPVANLALTPAGETVSGGFDVYVSLGDGKGNFAPATRQTHSIQWPAAALDKAGDRKMNYVIDVVLDPGPARISVGVIDHRSKKTGFARIEVPG